MASMRILVVEDERTLAGFFERGLSAEGYAVTSCTTASRPERWRGTGDYALVLLDVMLPEPSGLEVVEGRSGARDRGAAGDHADRRWP